MEPKMDQLAMKEDTVSRQTPAVKMVGIFDGQYSDSLCFNYHDNTDNQYDIMSMENAISHVAASRKDRICLEYPETLADVDNIEKIVDKCKDNEILIKSSEVGLTGKLIEFAEKKCLEKEKNTLVFTYWKEYSENPDEKPDVMSIDSALNRFCCQIAHDKISLFPQFVQSLKAMKNHNMLIEVVMDDFKELFLAMNWKFNPEMVNRGKNRFFKSRYITMIDLHADDDNNKYKMIQDEWDTDESDTESEDINSSMSEDGYSTPSELDGELSSDTESENSYSSATEDGYSTQSELDADISSEDEEHEPKKARLSDYATNVKPARVTSCYIEDELQADRGSTDAAVLVDESEHIEESSLDAQMTENAEPTGVNSFYVIEELEAVLGIPYATTLVDAPALVCSGLLLQSSLDDPLAQPVQPNLDVFGRVPSEMRFPGLPAFYDQNTDTWWNGEQGWTWNHGVAGAPDAVEDI